MTAPSMPVGWARNEQLDEDEIDLFPNSAENWLDGSFLRYNLQGQVSNFEEAAYHYLTDFVFSRIFRDIVQF